MKLFALNTFRMAKKNKGSFLGAVFVIAIGIFVFVAMIDTLQNLKGQVDPIYAEERHWQMSLRKSPVSLRCSLRPGGTSRLKKAPGGSQGRAGSGGGTDGDGIGTSIIGRGRGRGGRVPEPDDADHGEKYCGNPGHDLARKTDDRCLRIRAGGHARLLIGGISHEFVLAGTVSTPDSIYSIPPAVPWCRTGRPTTSPASRKSGWRN